MMNRMRHCCLVIFMSLVWHASFAGIVERNWSVGKPAKQSSTDSGEGAARAVDA
jgi:hypothetical protein